jgi:hypothetical protein
MKQLEYYTTESGKCPYTEWLERLSPIYQVKVLVKWIASNPHSLHLSFYTSHEETDAKPFWSGPFLLTIKYSPRESASGSNKNSPAIPPQNRVFLLLVWSSSD